MERLSKDRIKDRMLKTASKVWGIPENEIEANYDPLVLLLLEACSSELEKLNLDIQSSQNRLLGHLAEMMLPDVTSGAQPPSCVMKAAPIEGMTSIDSLTKFYCTTRIGSGNQSATADVHFTPIGKFPLLPTRLKYIGIGDKAYSIKESGTKEVLFEKNTNDNQAVSTIELVLTVDASLASLQGLSLFFDLRSHSEAPSFYQHLPSCKASINGNAIAIKSGYSFAEQFQPDPATMLENGANYTAKLNRLVAGTYAGQFLNIDDATSIKTLQQSSPSTYWQQLLPKEIIQKELAAPMIYLSLSLSKSFPRYVLESLMIAANAFPIVSRKMNTLNYRTNQWINIIPLSFEGAFLDIQSIQSSSGKYNYRMTPFGHDISEGEAYVRTSGIAKHNSREVREMVGNLMQAIRDESAYFNDISNDTIMNRLREVNQVLTRIQDQIKSAKDLREQFCYVLLKPKNSNETLSIQYWSMHLKPAKQVKAFTLLNGLDHTAVDAKSAYTITPLLGGKEYIADAEKKNYLRQEVSSKGKIISIEDVKYAAIKTFGALMKSVEVKKVIKTGSGKTNGFVRAIEVCITPTEEAQLNNPDELQYSLKELEFLLSENATPIFPYYVNIIQ